MSITLNEQELARRESLDKLRALGIEPYPAEEYHVSHLSTEIKDNSVALIEAKQKVSIAGRLMSRRIMGKASFAEIKDAEGRIQVYFNRDVLCSGEDKTLYNEVFKKLLDIGDILGLKGQMFTTQTGELSLEVQELTVLSKSLRVLPIVKTDDQGQEHDSFSDKEMRYRRRYVDLIVNDPVKDIFIKRSTIINSMRSFFNDKGYFEVETPILQNIPGGATARPFVTHHNALNIPLYLRIANELYLKRLIVGGFDGVYEFAKDFRNEGMDRTHNPEFTVMELYVAYKDYNWMMDFTETLLKNLAKTVTGDYKVQVGDKVIDFEQPFVKAPILDLIKDKTGHDLYGKSEAELRDICKQLKLEIDDTAGEGKIIDEIFGEFVEPTLVQPTFVTDYPVSMSPLTKKHRSKEGLTERFELIINTKEIANAYSELNDPIDQLARFEDQLKLSEKGDDEAMFIDQDFVRALEYGMPPTSGIGIGIDRLTMLLTNQDSIQEVLFFPQMKPEAKPVVLTDEEKTLLELVKEGEEQLLLPIKEASGLSNKKWDKTLKSLKQKNLITIEKKGDQLWVSRG